MKKVCVFFFSGTGMTKHFLNKLKANLENNNVDVSLLNIENIDIYKIDLSEYDLIGISYPVHSFNAPKLVVDFTKQLPKADFKKTFIAFTAGENSFSNYSSSNSIINILERKGYTVFYNNLFEMPSNFATRHNDDIVKNVLENLNKTTLNASNDIRLETPFFLKNTFSSNSISFIGKLEWLGAPFLGKLFYTNNKCTKCGICINNCPKNNILLSNENIKFKGKCMLCMRCIYSCPLDAISIRKPFNFIKLKNWYNPDLFLKEE